MENLCRVCGHHHKHEDGEPCSVCGHRKPTLSEKVAMKNPSPMMKVFTSLFGYRSPPQGTRSQIPNNTDVEFPVTNCSCLRIYALMLKKKDQPKK